MRRLVWLAVLGLLGGLLGLVWVAPVSTAESSAGLAAGSPAGRIVSDNPAGFTPHVLNGSVRSVVQAGDTIVLGGTFSSARNDDSQTTSPRSNLLAFNASTGRISATFCRTPTA